MRKRFPIAFQKSAKIYSVITTVPLLVTLLFLFISCNPGGGGGSTTTTTIAAIDSTTVTVGTTGGSITLDNTAAINFPAGAFSQEVTVQLLKTSDPTTTDTFNVTAPLFEVGNSLGYEVRIITDALVNRDVEAVLNVPETLLNSIPSGHQVSAFVQLYQDGGEESLDYFYWFSASYNEKNKTAAIALPVWAFTDRRRADGTFEAVITLATTPPPQSEGDVLSSASLSAAEDCPCPVSCPLQNGCTITGKFGVPIEDSTNKIHIGIDLAADTGSQVVAAENGEIFKYDYKPDFGNYLILKHNNFTCPSYPNVVYYTAYAHLKDIKQGKHFNEAPPTFDNNQVIKGQQIPGILTDNTGRSSETHLHFEVIVKYPLAANRIPFNPDQCINTSTTTIPQPPPSTTTTTIIPNGSIVCSCVLLCNNGNVAYAYCVASNQECNVACSNFRPDTGGNANCFSPQGYKQNCDNADNCPCSTALEICSNTVANICAKPTGECHDSTIGECK